MKVNEVREKYIEFFKASPRNHQEIDPAPIVPEVDTGTLFTPFGMQQLVPYLLGKEHPKGKRLVNSQPAIRLDDIEEVGNNRHTTFFEMLGNWSLGDYFKEEQLAWIWEFLTEDLKLPKEKIWISVFKGNDQVPRDTASIEIWKKLGVPEERIKDYGVKKNWWSMNGTPSEMPIGDIGGPTSEIFYEFAEVKHNPDYGKKCHQNCDCGRFLEIGNSVFMQYKKTGKNKLEELPNKNIDFGGGLERLVAAANDDPDIFKIDVFTPTISSLEEFVGKKYGTSDKVDKSYRIVADHLRAASYLIAEGVMPSNKLQGYIVRRLIRRSVFRLKLLGFDLKGGAISTFLRPYKKQYQKLEENWYQVKDAINDEAVRFNKALRRGLKKLDKLIEADKVSGETVFDLYQTEGFPMELTLEILEERGIKFTEKNKKTFKEEFEKHKEASRSASAGQFKGGLADHSEETIRLHTATHLLQESLRKVLGEHVIQKGQNITSKRSRFDFKHDKKLTEEEIEKVENLINQKTEEDLPVNKKEMKREKAEETGAIHAFGEKYGDTVNVYYVGKDLESAFSKEFCGGPHVSRTSEIGRVRIKKQDKIGANTVRIYLEIDK